MGTKGDGNRQRIIEAADQLFYTRGYNQTSFRDISEATGIPRGNFYYYFKTKDDILGAVVDARLKNFGKLLSDCEQRSDDPRQRILCFADMLSTFEDNVIAAGCPIGTLSTELAKEQQDTSELSRAVFSMIRKWLAEQFDAIGLARADDKAMDLLARIQGVTVMACAFGDREFLRRSLEDVKVWVNGLTLS